MTMRLYNDLAYLWPIVSPPEEYIVEAEEWLDVIRERLDANLTEEEAGNRRPTLLDLGCGGGHLLSHLTPHFTTEAVDISAEMLEISKRLNPHTVHHQGDMRTVRLGRTFDVVAIHDAVDYMLTEADLRSAVTTGAAHLNPGGLLLLAPDWFRETLSGPRVIDWTRDDAGRDVTFIEYIANPRDDTTIVESVFVFIIDENGQLRVELDRHTSGLFPMATWMRLLSEAGLDAEYIRIHDYEGGFGGNLFVGHKSPLP